MKVNRKLVVCALGLVFSLVMALPLSAQLVDKKALTLDAAKRIMAGAEAEAKKNNWKVVIAILDEGGHLIMLQRMDDVQTGSVEVALQKARSAASFRRPTKAFEDGMASGRTALMRLPGAMPFEGGVPITVDGKVIGAVGVSGVTAQQDGQIAQAGIDGLMKALGK